MVWREKWLNVSLAVGNKSLPPQNTVQGIRSVVFAFVGSTKQ